ncbi:MAG: hypothetical protein OEW75_14775 [Cyclobacteriaceae bacterium]|nr:hypothetical protein [Cyclobacteriaceae bacterium]
MGENAQLYDYYPFGLTFNSWQRGGSKKNDYLYNGKEMQDELDLGWMDYGARMYDGSIGRWHVIDLMIEKHYNSTPYAYVYNNPIGFKDDFGLDTLLVDKNGRFAENKLKGGDKDVIIKVSKKDVKNNTLRKNKDGSLKGSYRVSEGFEAGSVHTASTAEGTIVVTTNEQAEDVFNFLADNTVVEFSRIEFTAFENLNNQITTSHSQNSDSYGSLSVREIIKNENKKLISHTHSHLNSNQPIPSTPEHTKGSKTGDTGAYQAWSEKQSGTTIKFYIRYNGVTREFDKNGTEIKQR